MILGTSSLSEPQSVELISTVIIGAPHLDPDVYGSSNGDYFNLDAQPDGAICWFYGRDGLFVNALGIYVRPWSEEP